MREKKTKTNEQIAVKISVVSGAGNIVLAAFKLFAGIFGRSAAMVSDAIHSLSDVFSSMVVIAGVKIAAKDSDHDHQYGHERIECIAAIILSVVLCAVGLGIGYSGVKTVLYGNYDSIETPGLIALIAAVISIVSKEAMFWYTRNAAKKINSGALMAEAWHHRSDAMSSVGSLIGIAGAMLLGSKWTILDPLASCCISVAIIVVAIKMGLPSISELLEASLPEDVENNIRDTATSVPGVRNIHELKTRRNGMSYIIDAHILVDPTISVVESHDIASRVEEALTLKFGTETQINIHVEPDMRTNK